ncbi:MAG: hypothetical protein KJZ78_19570, partial [Bryobacteraceae bacterium]|nr:hypothetical protein [Bryobacteraceae bacterium]
MTPLSGRSEGHSSSFGHRSAGFRSARQPFPGREPPVTSEATFQDVARRAAHCLFHYQWKLWFWGDSIGLEGLLDASALTGDAAYFAYVHGLL